MRVAGEHELGLHVGQRVAGVVCRAIAGDAVNVVAIIVVREPVQAEIFWGQLGDILAERQHRQVIIRYLDVLYGVAIWKEAGNDLWYLGATFFLF